jgi:phospholipid/cholesterol/gamma-HCH transport system substrate-binding protein
VTVQVLRKSAVGEPYVELSPQAGSARPFANGDVIPLTRTKSTVDYQNLFRSAGNMLQAADPADLKTLTHQLAIGLNGQGQNLHDILADLDDVTQTLADHPDVLDGLAVQLTTLAGTLTDKRTQIASGLNNLAAFTATLSDSRRSLDKLLTDAPSFLQQTNSLLQTAKPGLKCLFTAFGVPAPPVFTSANAQATLNTLDNVYAGFPKVVNDVIEQRPEGDYVRLRVLITVAGPTPNARQYAKPRPDASIPPLYNCADTTTNGKTPSPTSGAKSDPANAMGPKAGDLFRTVKPPASREAASKDLAGHWLPRFPWMVAGAVLLGTAVHTTRRVYALARQRRRT